MRLRLAYGPDVEKRELKLYQVRNRGIEQSRCFGEGALRLSVRGARNERTNHRNGID
jgi:hypothetical protein